MKKIVILLLLLLSFIVLTGCSKPPSGQLEEKIRQQYIEYDRLDKFYELQEKYDNNKVILWINSKSDSWRITNFSIWLVFLAAPDLPEMGAVGTTLAIFYFIAWWLGITLTGGGILGVLAWIGGFFGGWPGLPPAILGILFLTVMGTVLARVFSLVF